MSGSRVIKRAYKYRFTPTPTQKDLLHRTFGCVRLVYNKALEERTRAWVSEQRSVSYTDTSAMLTGWKKTEELRFLNEVSSVPLQQSLRHLQGAFAAFWNKTANYPRFKSRKKSKLSAEFTRSAFSFEDGQLRLAKLAEPLDIVWSRPLPEGAHPSSVTVSCDRAGRWFVSLLIEEEIAPLEPVSTAVGIDLGLESFAVISDGRTVDNPRHSATERRRLARAQRSLSRKEKGSANWHKARVKVARIQAKVADRRRDFLHQLSTALICENQTVVLEDLAVGAMRAKGTGRTKTGLNRSMADASWAEFRSMLEYKADWYGRELVVIDRFFPSSQLCSSCGSHEGHKPLAVRRWTCTSCGASHERDHNAAKNILTAGLAASVCGDGRSLRAVA